jgi:hypothetical protein
MNKTNIFNNYKNETEFYSLIGIKMSTFIKMLDILTIAENKQKQFSERKNKLSTEERLFIMLEY